MVVATEIVKWLLPRTVFSWTVSCISRNGGLLLAELEQS
jgi:hypothetical protein